MGGSVEYSIQTTGFTGDQGRVTAVTTTRVAWEGRRCTPIPGSEETWPADLVLLAMGFLGPRPELLDQAGVARDERGNICSDPQTMMTSVPGVFACGDCRRGQSLVVWGIAEGREIARRVDAWLMDRPSLLPAVRLEPFEY